MGKLSRNNQCTHKNVKICFYKKFATYLRRVLLTYMEKETYKWSNTTRNQRLKLLMVSPPNHHRNTWVLSLSLRVHFSRNVVKSSIFVLWVAKKCLLVWILNIRLNWSFLDTGGKRSCNSNTANPFLALSRPENVVLTSCRSFLVSTHHSQSEAQKTETSLRSNCWHSNHFHTTS